MYRDRRGYRKNPYYRGYRYYHTRFIIGIVMMPLVLCWYLLNMYVPGILERINFTYYDSFTVIIMLMVMFMIPYIGIVYIIYKKWRKELGV
jgi:hypothetical protein